MTTEAMDMLEAISAEMGSKPRTAQVAALKFLETVGPHAALRLPTGTGKSVVAAAVAAAAEGGAMIAMFSNGLVSQYLGDMSVWEQATGKTFAAIVGAGHYHCQKALPTADMVQRLGAKAAAYVADTGTFIGSGLPTSIYTEFTVKAVSAPSDPNSDDDETTAPTSPCKACPFKENGCSLWEARRAAASADVVVTNVTLMALAAKAIGAPDTGSWISAIARRTLIVDEAHAAAEPVQSILGTSVTLSRRTTDRETADAASRSATAALNAVHTIANTQPTPNDGAKLLALRGRARMFLKDLGKRTPIYDGDIPKSKGTLTVPVDLRSFFAPFKVVAMSGTLTDHYVRQLGLDAEVEEFIGLDVSGSTVTEVTEFPKWRYANKADGYSVTAHAEWAKATAKLVSEAFYNGGRTLLICQSNADLDAIVTFLDKAVLDAVIVYKSGVDRVTAVKTYRANPDKHIMAGFASGAGTGLNLPHDLIRQVIISRVPQSCPKGADRVKFMEDTKSAIVQSVGRGHRADNDWAKVQILGGFGARADIKSALLADGWVLS